MQSFKEGNACWNCRNLTTCHPLFRPLYGCCRFIPLGEPISHKKIGELLGVDLNSINTDIREHGAEKIVNDLLEIGRTARFDTIGNYIRFYMLN